MSSTLSLALAALVLTSAATSEPKVPTRVVSVGGAVTETVFALGEGRRVVGVDATSRFPAEVTLLPQVGVHRDLSVEGVLSLSPDLVLLGDDAAPAVTVEQLRAAGVRVVVVPREPSVEGVRRSIRVVAEALGKEAAGEALLAQLSRSLAALDEGASSHRPRVAYVYAAGSGSLHVAGSDTAADAIVTLAGGANAITGYTGYRPLNAEALIAARPEVILFPARALGAIGGVEGLLRAPGVALTPAGRSGRVIPVDDTIALGFGPRLPEGIALVRGLLTMEERAAP